MKLSRSEFLKNLALLGATLSTGVGFTRYHTEDSNSLRPPGALPEKDFLSRCIRCGRCGNACPNQCIVPFTPDTGREVSLRPGVGEEGTPVIIPRRQACNLCASDKGDVLQCTAACPTGALRLVSKEPQQIQERARMGVARVEPDLCHSYSGSSCGVCIRACPFEGHALRADLGERPVVDPAQCVGCGLCERACIRYPQAITVDPRRTG